MSHADRFYLSVTIFLLAATIAGGIMLHVRHSRNQPVEIVLSQSEPPAQNGEVYIRGDVANPGIYPWQDGDTLQAILSDAGIEPGANLRRIEIYVPPEVEEKSAQKIDINRAEPWLLEALPGIGEALAQRIVDYRNQNGPFKRVDDLLKVKGIAEGTLNKIRDYITVSD